jgi:hypothetical protein
MRETIQNKMLEDSKAINDFMEVYNDYIPPPSGGPPTANDMLMEKIGDMLSSVAELTDVLIAEHPPGIKTLPGS